MTTLHEAAQQALTALQFVATGVKVIDPPQSVITDTIKALRSALAQQGEQGEQPSNLMSSRTDIRKAAAENFYLKDKAQEIAEAMRTRARNNITVKAETLESFADDLTRIFK